MNPSAARPRFLLLNQVLSIATLIFVMVMSVLALSLSVATSAPLLGAAGPTYPLYLGASIGLVVAVAAWFSLTGRLAASAGLIALGAGLSLAGPGTEGLLPALPDWFPLLLFGMAGLPIFLPLPHTAAEGG